MAKTEYQLAYDNFLHLYGKLERTYSARREFIDRAQFLFGSLYKWED